MMLTILAISGIVTIGIGVIKTTKSFFWKGIWWVVVVFLEGNLVRSSRFSLPYYGNARIIIT